jgi:hypothetical protein
LFVRRKDVFLLPTLNWNESYSLWFKQDKLQFTAKNYILLSVCVCHKLFSGVAGVAVVLAAAAAASVGGGDII